MLHLETPFVCFCYLLCLCCFILWSLAAARPTSHPARTSLEPQGVEFPSCLTLFLRGRPELLLCLTLFLRRKHSQFCPYLLFLPFLLFPQDLGCLYSMCCDLRGVEPNWDCPVRYRDPLSTHSSPYRTLERPPQPHGGRSMPTTPVLTRNAYSSSHLQ